MTEGAELSDFAGQSASPTVAVIVPAFNASSTLFDCLTAIRALSFPVAELIVYIDGATDDSEAIARNAGARVIVNPDAPKGPSHGRNEGAAASQSDLLLFVDADVIISRDALSTLVKELVHEGAVAAFGSYDCEPRSTRTASYYANLRHHHVHQNSVREASTFWTGLGLVRRDVFLKFGGFDIEKYRYPSIEDVELGMRITGAGLRIRLVPEALAKHCKDWTLANVWHTDIFRRAYPWSCLLIDGRGKTVDLNLDRVERLKALLAMTALGSALIGLFAPFLLILTAIALCAYLALNRSFFALLAKMLGYPRAAGAMAMHFCYHIYATATYAFTLVQTSLGLRHRDGVLSAKKA